MSSLVAGDGAMSRRELQAFIADSSTGKTTVCGLLSGGVRASGHVLNTSYISLLFLNSVETHMEFYMQLMVFLKIKSPRK